ncbi:MAG: valine--pyruvate transaminase [Planctomycetota bacterium]|jgi:valine--pyruvate aminotransferase
MEVSKFGKKIGLTSGIGVLMEDLGNGLNSHRDVIMLGGGNPAHIPAVEEHLRDSMERLLGEKGRFERTVGDYGPPGGSKEFIDAICELLNGQFGWGISDKNVALTNGSQSAFFILFNIFAGAFDGGVKKKILLPLAPEYIGYSDVGLTENLFTAVKARIEHIDEHIFKYHIDFDKLTVSDDIGAICVSRPTNPSSNVLTDEEVGKLAELAQANDIPLIIDNAYGTPFPNIIFTQAAPVWNEQTIVCMSLSKFGLPGVRTGIVIANEEIVRMVSQVNAVMSLAPGSLGAELATDIIRSGEVLRISREVIEPFYRKKATRAVEILREELDGVDFHIHQPEGAIFLWLWLRAMPVTCEELYQRLKKRGVLVVPGHYFFPGLTEQWRHKDECIRINYAPDEAIVEKGLKVIAEEVRQAYNV